MSEHLPECWYSDPDKVPAVVANDGYPCVCDRLRACEQRMLDDDVPAAAYHGEKGYTMGYAAALDAAEQVVAACGNGKGYIYSDTMTGVEWALDAIRSLKEKP